MSRPLLLTPLLLFGCGGETAPEVAPAVAAMHRAEEDARSAEAAANAAPPPNARGYRGGDGIFPDGTSLAAARANFRTMLREDPEDTDPVPPPPEGRGQLVSYPGPLGEMAAYLVVPEGEGPRPAIVWVLGGFSNSIGPFLFEEAAADNDQTAAALPAAGVVTMYPSRRGSHGNPGERELLFGEVDDVLAAARWLAGRPEVDPDRVYIGGHSTGGTVALLAAQSGGTFRGVVSLGPTYELFPPDQTEEIFGIAVPKEAVLRAPGFWMENLSSPTWVIEGANDGNAEELERLRQAAKSADAPATFAVIPGEDHFSIVRRVCGLFAAEIAEAAETDSDIDLTEEEVVQAFATPAGG